MDRLVSATRLRRREKDPQITQIKKQTKPQRLKVSQPPIGKELVETAYDVMAFKICVICVICGFFHLLLLWIKVRPGRCG
jgi:hypothetical protein